MIIYDTQGDIVDHNQLETTEWKLAEAYVKPNDVVLELGARFGSTSVTLNKIAKGKNIVCIEPDETVLETLENNRKINNCDFNIVKGIISKTKQSIYLSDYSTYTTNDESGNIQIYDLWQLQKDYNLEFNVLVADCEGCLSTFFHHYKEFFKQLRLVIFEMDRPESFNYKKFINLLLDMGFKCEVNGFHCVYIKN
jgi:FkbM family methyltransferase